MLAEVSKELPGSSSSVAGRARGYMPYQGLGLSDQKLGLGGLRGGVHLLARFGCRAGVRTTHEHAVESETYTCTQLKRNSFPRSNVEGPNAAAFAVAMKVYGRWKPLHRLKCGELQNIANIPSHAPCLTMDLVTGCKLKFQRRRPGVMVRAGYV